VCTGKRKKEDEEVWGRIFSSYVWRNVHGTCVCKNQTWKEVVFCSKYLFLSNPPLDLCQILISFSWRGVKGSPKISASLELL
jgi:hypothetical protein